jgi:hypothetical protein
MSNENDAKKWFDELVVGDVVAVSTRRFGDSGYSLGRVESIKEHKRNGRTVVVYGTTYKFSFGGGLEYIPKTSSRWTNYRSIHRVTDEITTAIEHDKLVDQVRHHLEILGAHIRANRGDFDNNQLRALRDALAPFVFASTSKV